MARTGPNMGLQIWDQLTDPYDHNQLAANWDKVDQHDHSSGRGVQIPTGGIADGAITSVKLASGVSVATATYATHAGTVDAGGVSTASIQNNAVTTAQIADGSITNLKVAANTLTGDRIQDNQIILSKLTTAVVNNFLKLATPGTAAIKFGVSATGSFGGNPQVGWSIAHGLGYAPTVAFLAAGGISTFSSVPQVPVVGSVNQLDSTTLGGIFRTSNNDSTNNSTPVYWVVIG